jgi:plastocyanin
MRPQQAMVKGLLLIGLAAAACSSGPASTPPPGPSAAVTTPSVLFAPANLTIPVGTTVIWTNATSVGHNVAADDGSFGGSLYKGQTVWHTFAQLGTYHYICSLHTFMKGTVTVR